jgi:RNA 2',3'-cyclic 3'-phosphodiesterase
VPRLFVAIDFPAELKLGLAGLCAGVPGVKWVAPEKFHLTLRFIGDVDDATAAAIAAALGRIEMPRFQLTLAGVGKFGGHTLWVGVEPNPALLRLQSAIESALQQIAPAVDPRPFMPHVKLARSRRRRGFREFLDEHAGFRAEPFEVAEFTLVESHPGKSGSIYELRAHYALLAAEAPAPRTTAAASDAAAGEPAGARR